MDAIKTGMKSTTVVLSVPAYLTTDFTEFYSSVLAHITFTLPLMDYVWCNVFNARFNVD